MGIREKEGRRAYHRRSIWPWRRRSRGQSLVEFALISPLFLALLFGIIEYALINASIGAFDFAAFEGARVGAIDGQHAVVGQLPTGASPDGGVDADILANGIMPHVQGIVFAHIAEVDVFRANASGGCYSGELTFPCSQYEDIYTPDLGWTAPPNGGATWPDATRDDQLIGADYLGVRVKYTYTYITSLLAEFSPTLTLTAVSVQRIEPQEYTGQVPSSAWQARSVSQAPPSPANVPLGQWPWRTIKQPTMTLIPGKKAIIYAA